MKTQRIYNRGPGLRSQVVRHQGKELVLRDSLRHLGVKPCLDEGVHALVLLDRPSQSVDLLPVVWPVLLLPLPVRRDHVQAAHHWHVDVAEHHVEGSILEDLQGLLAVPRGHHVHPGLLQRPRQLQDDAEHVVHNERGGLAVLVQQRFPRSFPELLFQISADSYVESSCEPTLPVRFTYEMATLFCYLT